MSSIVVLQARTNSTRLPGKVLLPVSGYPLVVLAAKRAGNTGKRVVVVTSNESSDDVLAATLERYSIEYYRGSLNNVLSRVVEALSLLPDNTIVFRLTADNLFPDGYLVDQIEENFITKGLSYSACNGYESGLPYGVSVEAMRLLSLREACKYARDDGDLEHVTPYVIRKFGRNFFTNYKSLAAADLRCTVDCLDDYLLIDKVFSEITDPVNVSLDKLVKMLEKHKPYYRVNSKGGLVLSKLVLGGAQLGLDYGITNTSGKSSFEESSMMVKTAISNGVQYIDTARAYGESEEVIGSILSPGWAGRTQVITKLSVLPASTDKESTDAIKVSVQADVYCSCRNLDSSVLDVVMMHRASHIYDWGGVVIDQLRSFVTDGVIREIGVSVQSPEELEMALSIEDLSFIQLPYNILDWRWDSMREKIIQAKSARKLVIHARSILLQGVLTSDDDEHWQQANIKDPVEFIAWLESYVSKSSCSDVATLCLVFVNSIDWIDGLVVGNANLKQLHDNMNAICLPLLSKKLVSEIIDTRPKVSERTLNPALWSLV